jgi:choline kinase
MTKVLILAAGQGTRLRPITNDRPKCLVPLLGRSLLERQTDVLKSAGLTNIHIATGYRSDQIEKLGYETSFNALFDKTNMVESLFSAIEFIEGEEDLIIAYGDIVYQKNNLDKVLASNDEIALMIDKEWKAFWSLRLENPLDDAETLKLDDEGFVIELGKKTESYDDVQGQYTGLIKIRGDKIRDFIDFYNSIDKTLNFDGQDFNNMYMTSFLQMMIDSGWKAKGVLVNNGWLEIDTVEDLTTYETMHKNGELSPFYIVN